MPYTSKRFTEYQQHWAHRPVVTFSRPCSSSASDSRLPDVFTEDGAKKFCDLNFKHVSWDDLDEPTRDEFIKLAPEVRRLMTIKFGTVHLFAARIWRIIDAAIFQKTDTKSIKWTRDYFKYQDGMLKELRKLNPTAPHSHFTEMWQQWDWLSVCLHDEMIDSLETPGVVSLRPYMEDQISLDCFQQVIVDGIGPLFPKNLCNISKDILRRLGYFFISWETQFSFSKDYHYFLTDEEEAEMEDDAGEHGKVVKKEVEMKDDDAKELSKADEKEIGMEGGDEEHGKVVKEDDDAEKSRKVVKEEVEREGDAAEERIKAGKAEKDKSAKDRLSVDDARPTKRRGLRSASHK
ncbi:hypothetical protein QQZ08_012336 [Neonectria magnoliae]|uniref:Uncharacterized protein n=1 Tax=Neonectria magnoliae TaxID=2732573 RepID=A0ABR1H340_9HYPO